MNKNVFISKEISKYGLISGHMFLLASYFSHIKGLNIPRNLLFLLYLTTILYWYKLDDNSIRKFLDMVVAFITISYFTFYEINKLSNNHKKIWYLLCFNIIVIYILNTVVYQTQIVNDSDYVMESEDYNYFKFKYTKSNTKERKMSCIYNVLIHIISLHVIPCLIYIYVLINN